MGSGWVLAVDFGTSNTTAAYAADGGAPAVLQVENSQYLPSVVVAGQDGQLLTGKAAEQQAVFFPDRAERTPKRAMAAGGQVVLGGRALATVELAAAVLGRVYTEAVRFHGGVAPRRVVLTHPARWGETLQDRLRAAAARAGIAGPALMPEPVAAAWCYSPPAAGQFVAVFDLGGGTLDTAVLKADGGTFTPAGPPGGDPELGGEDFDELLLGQVEKLALERDPALWEDSFAGAGLKARRERWRLRADVRVAKEALSEQHAHDLLVGDYHEPFRLTRPEFEQLISAMTDQATAEMARTITAAGLQPAQLAHLYLTGGSSRIPAIATRLGHTFNRVPRMEHDPKTVVALGALTAHTTQPQTGTGTSSAAAALPSRELHRLQHDDDVCEVAFSPDGSRLATGSDDNLARIWDASTGRELTRLQHGGCVSSVAFSPDGSRLATASHQDNLARIWDASTGRELTRLQHDNWVLSVAFSPDGTRLATGSIDELARIWDASTGRELTRLQHTHPVFWVAFSPHGTRLATGSGGGQARIWGPW